MHDLDGLKYQQCEGTRRIYFCGGGPERRRNRFVTPAAYKALRAIWTCGRADPDACFYGNQYVPGGGRPKKKAAPASRRKSAPKKAPARKKAAPAAPEKVIVTIPGAAERNSKSWRKILTGVTTAAAGGYAFLGLFVPGGRKQDLPIGTHVLGYDEVGYDKKRAARVTVWRVQPDASLGVVYEDEVPIRGWAREVRDEIALVLAGRM